ncbi:MAG: OPT family oligopeptide transporter [Myxococcales bacterium]
MERPDPAAAADHDPFASDRAWRAEVYRGDTVRQLSVRSLVSGMAIGAVMSISNLYVGLKTGWGLGVTITACIIAFSVFKALEAIVPAYRKDPFSILENNTMSSAASAAGYMATSGLASALPALYMTTGRVLTWWETMPWLFATSVLGVFLAVPLKRQLINHDKLPFPSGIATAETLRSMHTVGREAVQKARSLIAASVLGAVLAFLRDAPAMGKHAIPSAFPLFWGERAKRWLDDLTIGFEGSSIMVAAGAIMGIRVGISLLLGAVLFFGVAGEMVVSAGIVKPGYRSIVSWTLWPATAMMISSSITSLCFRWRTIGRALSGVGDMFRADADKATQDPLADIEVPVSWTLWGTLLSGLACVMLGHWFFQITWWMGVLAVLATFLLSIVAARATGETDVTPIGALGKITQLAYGVIAPANITTNLMTASITSAASAHAADLLTDLKSGYLLGGSPRKQTIAQLFGVLAGTLMCVPVYTLIATPEKLGSEELPAPAAKVWAGVAEMLAKGLEALPKGALIAVVFGAAIGIGLAVAEELLPAKYRKWLPSATGLGIAGVIPAFNSISMFIGALAAWLIGRTRPQVDQAYTIPVSSGLIAGESLMGVAIMVWLEGPKLLETLGAFFSAK